MALWFLLLPLCISFCVHGLLGLLSSKKLPPCPPSVPVLGNILWLLKSSRDFSSLEPVLRYLRLKYGDVVRLQMASRPAIFIMSREAAHKVLVQQSTTFAGRPSKLEASRILFGDQRTVSTAAYTPLWRKLRQNFMSVVHPSRLKMYADGRKWALKILRDKLRAESEREEHTVVYEIFQLVVFSLLVFMCFGEKFDERKIQEIVAVQQDTVRNFIKFNIFDFAPTVGKYVFRKTWKELLQIRKNQEDVLLPLIKARVTTRKQNGQTDEDEGEFVVSYVDTITDMEFADNKRKANDAELVSLCTEFLIAGTNTTIGTLQWAMANIVKYPSIQTKLLNEINSMVEPNQEIQEEDLEKMPYLRAIVLETLRRHPPAHFIFPRAITEDATIGGYHIPKNAIVNFTVAEMGRDPNVWEEPTEFRPERFLGEAEFDINCTREIKMMPFGAGRRICPAIAMTLLHLGLFVANMVRDFEWRPANGEDVDLTEVQNFSIVMKTPLSVRLVPRTIGSPSCSHSGKTG